MQEQRPVWKTERELRPAERAEPETEVELRLESSREAEQPAVLSELALRVW